MKFECDMVKDLMPLCIDNMASEASKKVVQEHLKECEGCSSEWNKLQNGIDSLLETEVPEETKQYVKTAKRIQKRVIRMIAITAITTAIVLGSIKIIMTFGVAGGRFTLEKALMNGVKKEGITQPVEIIWTDEINEIILTDSQEYKSSSKICFLQYTDEQSNKQRFLTAYVFKVGPCWFYSGRLHNTEMKSEHGIYALSQPLAFSDSTGYYYYVTDPAIHKIVLTDGEQTYTVITD